MNALTPYLFWVKLAVVAGVLIGTYVFGRHNGAMAAENAQAREERIAHIAFESSQKAAAEAISEIEIKHTTIQGRLEREVRVETQYRDCVHSPDALRLLNDALENRQPSDSPGSSELPEESRSPDRP